MKGSALSHAPAPHSDWASALGASRIQLLEAVGGPCSGHLLPGLPWASCNHSCRKWEPRTSRETTTTKGLWVAVLNATSLELRLDSELHPHLSVQRITPPPHCWCLLLAQQRVGQSGVTERGPWGQSPGSGSQPHGLTSQNLSFLMCRMLILTSPSISNERIYDTYMK